jgi:hypothetical protein
MAAVTSCARTGRTNVRVMTSKANPAKIRSNEKADAIEMFLIIYEPLSRICETLIALIASFDGIVKANERAVKQKEIKEKESGGIYQCVSFRSLFFAV